MITTEDQHQKHLIQWATMQSLSHPELARLFHIPNGGKRNAREAAKFKSMGVRPGVPDLALPVAKQGYHHLYIELKSEKGYATKAQKEWGEFLRSEGSHWVICKGWVEAAHAIADYLSMPNHLKP